MIILFTSHCGYNKSIKANIHSITFRFVVSFPWILDNLGDSTDISSILLNCLNICTILQFLNNASYQHVKFSFLSRQQ